MRKMQARRIHLFVLSIAFLVPVSPAQAVESAVVLPPQGSASLADERARLGRALERSLRESGIRVIARSDLRAGPEGAAGCGDSTCADAVIEASGAGFVVSCSLWASDGGDGRGGGARAGGDTPASASVSMVLVDGRGALYPVRVDAPPGDLVRAGVAALARARGLLLMGPGPWLDLGGEPEGARVYLDGKLAGTVPYRAPIKPGRYELVVEAEGHTAWREILDIPMNKMEEIAVAVRLQPVAGAVASSATAQASGADLRLGTAYTGSAEPIAPPELAGGDHQEGPARRASAWNLIAGAGLLLAGGLLAVSPLRTLVEHGQCQGPTDAGGRCERAHFGAQSAALAAGSAIALGAGVVVLVFEPFSVEVKIGNGRERARARLDTERKP